MLAPRLLATAVAGVVIATPALAAPQVGQAAPAFSLVDAYGQSVALARYRGKPVVLEWNNPGCPFVQKHYGSGNMQRTQSLAQQSGAVWLTINSGAPGKQGYMTGAQAARFVKTAGSRADAYLLDPAGVVGRAYAARATPELYVIDPAGTLVYMGGIDDKATADVADIKGARNHVLAALAELKAGKPVSMPVTRAYGCSVKYEGA
jgi:hypothetical protein